MCFKRIIDGHKKKIWNDTLTIMDGIITKRKRLFDSLLNSRTLEMYLEDESSLISKSESIYKKIGEAFEEHALLSSWIQMLKYNHLLERIRDEVIHTW